MLYGKNGTHPYNHYEEIKECWRALCAGNAVIRVRGEFHSNFSTIAPKLATWWRDCAANPHGWDVKLKAKRAKGWAR